MVRQQKTKSFLVWIERELSCHVYVDYLRENDNMKCFTITTHGVIICHIFWALYHIVLYHLVSFYLMSYHVIAYYIISYHITLCHVVLCHLGSCHMMSWHCVMCRIQYLVVWLSQQFFSCYYSVKNYKLLTVWFEC